MITADWLVVTAVLLGPAVAVAAVRYLDRKRESLDRKLGVFRALMATRAHTTSWEHIEALSRIDTEFDARIDSEAGVIDAWKRYVEVTTDSGLTASDWSQQRSELLVDLLEKMARVVGHDFDRNHIQKSASLRLPVVPSKSSP